MNFYRIRSVISYIPRKILFKLNPTLFDRRQGVIMRGKVYFYGVPSLGTEPWLIELGDNVHITRDVTFVTHDGGTLLFRHMVPDLEITKPIIVGDNVYIGIRSIILPGVIIGNNVIMQDQWSQGMCQIIACMAGCQPNLLKLLMSISPRFRLNHFILAISRGCRRKQH